MATNVQYLWSLCESGFKVFEVGNFLHQSESSIGFLYRLDYFLKFLICCQGGIESLYLPSQFSQAIVSIDDLLQEGVRIEEN